MAVVADDVLTPLDPDADKVSRRRARKWWWAAGVFGAIAVVAMTWAGRQSNSQIPPAPPAFCKAAERYEKELDRQQIAYERDVGRQISYVEDIAATAPKAVRADAETFLQALRDLEAAPDKAAKQALKDDPDIRQAVDNVNRYWNQGCGVFDRQSGI
jgi:hypothetical protein